MQFPHQLEDDGILGALAKQPCPGGMVLHQNGKNCKRRHHLVWSSLGRMDRTGSPEAVPGLLPVGGVAGEGAADRWARNMPSDTRCWSSSCLGQTARGQTEVD